MSWTLEKIRSEVRFLTGFTPDSISDGKVNEIIQNFWTVSLPALIKPENYSHIYRFLTRKGVASYPFPENFTSLSPNATIENFPLQASYDDSIITRYTGNWIEQSMQISTQTPGPVQINLTHYPIPQTICVFTNELSFFLSDNNLSYNPDVNAVIINIETNLPVGEYIHVKYRATNLAKPCWIIIKDSSITLVPTPHKPYVIEILGMKKPDPLPSDSNLNIPQEFCDLIVYGASLKIFSIRDFSRYQELLPIYKRYESIAMSKTYQQLMYTTVTGI